jgi:threonine dehydratase
MWPLVSALLAGSVVVSVDAIAAAIRLLAARARVIAEGAGAAPLAAAIKVGKDHGLGEHHEPGEHRELGRRHEPGERHELGSVQGAGADLASATARAWQGVHKVVCVVSGGNIDAKVLARILSGQTP